MISPRRVPGKFTHIIHVDTEKIRRENTSLTYSSADTKTTRYHIIPSIIHCLSSVRKEHSDYIQRHPMF